MVSNTKQEGALLQLHINKYLCPPISSSELILKDYIFCNIQP